ncbi:hypothetical protein [Flavobacterium sharifuzzamanii]|uniref:hypothetical protein n=1 Tax=Flavobacterium sharifuzzamanii TaxID=2211133 RepID=UPI000DAD388B|nr:hypothetical protein [Flavobacterium sharifuzzamanii]KAF2081842.1 hypothetical protein DMA14_05080 [Flavobacterium sharifuzzamanii]
MAQSQRHLRSTGIVDDNKLQDSLTNKYTIFFVNGDEFIKPRKLSYTSYYPRRDKDWNVVQNKIKDTLYFKLDNEYVYQSKVNPKWYLIKDSNDKQHLFFEKQDIQKGSAINKLINFKEFVESSRFYNKDRKQKLYETSLVNFLGNYVVYFVKTDERELIKVNVGEVVYD